MIHFITIGIPTLWVGMILIIVGIIPITRSMFGTTQLMLIMVHTSIMRIGGLIMAQDTTVHGTTFTMVTPITAMALK